VNVGDFFDALNAADPNGKTWNRQRLDYHKGRSARRLPLSSAAWRCAARRCAARRRPRPRTPTSWRSSAWATRPAV
jgi:hypothetical protein